MDKIFLKILSFDRNSFKIFGLLPSILKVFLYRLFGAKIGKDVLIPRGTYIICGSISLGNNVEFGKNCFFKSAQLSIGKYATFEDNVCWLCRKITIGEAFYCSAWAKVGWGGEFDDEAELIIGDMSFVGEEAMLNPCRLIKIGNNSAVGAGTKVYTHQFWQSVLEGYEARFLPVTIEDNVMVGCNAAILPGSNIKQGSTVSANSMVCGQVKEYALVGGIPAVELPASKLYPRKLDDQAKDKILKSIFDLFIEKVRPDNKNRFFYCFDLEKVDSLPDYMRESRRVVLTYNFHEKEMFYPELTIFDCAGRKVLGKQDYFSDALREFLRKRGIRFSPLDWRYKRKRAV